MDEPVATAPATLAGGGRAAREEGRFRSRRLKEEENRKCRSQTHRLARSLRSVGRGRALFLVFHFVSHCLEWIERGSAPAPRPATAATASRARCDGGKERLGTVSHTFFKRF